MHTCAAGDAGRKLRRGAVGMKTILRREGRRLRDQLRHRLDLSVSGLRRFRYDRRRAADVRIQPGEQPAREEMAVMLIFQPDGVLESTLFTLSWLCRQGVSPVVVSNLPLTERDRARLSPLCHLLIERPNLGYDFGGYREGILTLLERGVRMRALYVMNDSIWFPLREDCDAIARARQSDTDLYGLFCNTIMRRRQKVYVQSYFFRFGADLLASREFLRFWRGLPFVRAKKLVVRRLERRLTRHFVERGFTLGYLHGRHDMIDVLLSLDDAELRAAVDHMIAAFPKEAAALRPLIRADVPFAESRPGIEALIRRGRVQTSFSFAHPAVLARLGVPFLKKTRCPEAMLQRGLIRQNGLAAGFAEPVRAEIAGWD